jgi:hypothetical protein
MCWEKTSPVNAYDIAWEYTALGETSVSSAYLIDAIIVGTRIKTIQQESTTAPPLQSAAPQPDGK